MRDRRSRRLELSTAELSRPPGDSPACSAQLLPHLSPTALPSCCPFCSLPPGNQPEMGNSRPGCRLEEVFSQARIASIGSARQARGRTVTPEVAVRVARLMQRFACTTKCRGTPSVSRTVCRGSRRGRVGRARPSRHRRPNPHVDLGIPRDGRLRSTFAGIDLIWKNAGQPLPVVATDGLSSA